MVHAIKDLYVANMLLLLIMCGAVKTLIALCPLCARASLLLLGQTHASRSVCAIALECILYPKQRTNKNSNFLITFVTTAVNIQLQSGVFNKCHAGDWVSWVKPRAEFRF